MINNKSLNLDGSIFYRLTLYLNEVDPPIQFENGKVTTMSCDGNCDCVVPCGNCERRKSGVYPPESESFSLIKMVVELCCLGLIPSHIIHAWFQYGGVEPKMEAKKHRRFVKMSEFLSSKRGTKMSMYCASATMLAGMAMMGFSNQGQDFHQLMAGLLLIVILIIVGMRTCYLQYPSVSAQRRLKNLLDFGQYLWRISYYTRIPLDELCGADFARIRRAGVMTVMRLAEQAYTLQQKLHHLGDTNTDDYLQVATETKAAEERARDAYDVLHGFGLENYGTYWPKSAKA